MKRPENALQRNNPRCPRRSPHPLTPEIERKRDELYARWLAKGKQPSAGLRNLATCIARSVIAAAPHDHKWGLRLAGHKGLLRGGFANMTPAQKQKVLAGLAKGRQIIREKQRLKKLAKQSPDGKLSLRKRLPPQ